jgi:nickel-dependent lactate racemase
MKFAWGYGKGTMAFEVPEGSYMGTLRSSPAQPIADLKGAVEDALENPIAWPPMREMFRTGERVAVLVPDWHRSWVRVATWLPMIIAGLNRAGIASRDIKVVIATGTHVPPTYDEIRCIIGDRLPGEVRVVAHNARDPRSCVYLGRSRAGTPIWLDHAVLGADALVLTGAVAPHTFAGYSGGRKAVVPGIAGLATVLANHSLALAAEGGVHSQARPGILEGNPVHEDMLDIAARLKPRFLVNFALNETGEFLGVFAGDFIEAHRRGCEFVSDRFRSEIPGKADIVIAGRGGHPMDLTVYQAFQSGANDVQAVKLPGGSLILVGACSDGLGPYEFARFFDHSSLEEIEAELHRNFTVPGFVVYRVALLARSVERLYLVSDLEPSIVEKIGIIPKPTIQAALDESLEMMPEGNVLLMPNASQTIPSLRSSS